MTPATGKDLPHGGGMRILIIMASAMEQIRGAIRQGRKSRYQISQETGVPQSQLCRVVNNGYGLSLRALELVAGSLGLEVVLRRRRRKGR